MISVVLATYNESANIERCLSAVADLADEIIIADGESTDNTVKKAKAFGARIISTTNKPNFHINKQLAMDAAKGDLVLQLDADEIVDTELAAFIRDVHTHLIEQKSTLPPDFPAAWWIKRKNLFLGRFLTKGGQYPDPVIRLYRRGLARLPQKDVHEQMQVDGEIGWAEGHLDHYANPSFELYLHKFNTYTSFKATQLDEAGITPSLGKSIQFLIWKPFVTWFQLFVRHKGFVDGVPGFVFASFSGLHHAVAYLKLWEIHAKA